MNASKPRPLQQQQQQAQQPQRQSQRLSPRQSQTHGDGESSAPLDRRPARRTNPATVHQGSETARRSRPSSYQGDYQVTSHARPRILLIRSNTDRSSQQVDSTVYNTTDQLIYHIIHVIVMCAYSLRQQVSSFAKY